MSKEEIIELIDELTDRLEGPAAKLYELAIERVYVTSVGVILFAGLVLAFCIWGFRKAVQRAQESRYGYEDGLGFVVVLIGVVGLLAVWAIFVASVNIITPELVAIRILVPGF